MYEEYLEHFPEEIGPEIKNYAIEDALKSSRYLFTRREGKKQFAYCTHCGKESRSSGLKHNEKAECPHCKSICCVKASGRGRGKMVDNVYFTYYEKSEKDPDVIIARGIYVTRDYRSSYKNVQTRFYIEAFYIFQMGNSIMFKSSYYSPSYFTKCASVYSLSSYWANKSYVMNVTWSRKSIEEAVKGTPFQYSTWEEYYPDDMIKFFNLYSKYPLIECLTKEGFSNIVGTKIDNQTTYGAINWRGKTIFKLLKVNRKQLKALKASKLPIGTLELKLFQLSEGDKSCLTLDEILQAARGYACYMEYVKTLLKYTTLKKVHKYLNKQVQVNNQHFKGTQNAILTWKDYIEDCIKLQWDLTLDTVLFPKNLYTAHQNTIKQVKVKADEELNRQIRLRLDGINKKYAFENKEFLIRAANDSIELLEEGKTLQHCVGTYADRYAKGQTIILLIRQKADPNKPFYTMEVCNGRIVQVRGKKNCNATIEVENFVKAFTAAKFKTSKSKMKKSA